MRKIHLVVLGSLITSVGIAVLLLYSAYYWYYIVYSPIYCVISPRGNMIAVIYAKEDSRVNRASYTIRFFERSTLRVKAIYHFDSYEKFSGSFDESGSKFCMLTTSDEAVVLSSQNRECTQIHLPKGSNAYYIKFVGAENNLLYASFVEQENVRALVVGVYLIDMHNIGKQQMLKTYITSNAGMTIYSNSTADRLLYTIPSRTDTNVLQQYEILVIDPKSGSTIGTSGKNFNDGVCCPIVTPSNNGRFLSFIAADNRHSPLREYHIYYSDDSFDKIRCVLTEKYSDDVQRKMTAVSDDGSYVFLTSRQRLTLDDMDDEVDIYRFDTNRSCYFRVTKYPNSFAKVYLETYSTCSSGRFVVYIAINASGKRAVTIVDTLNKTHTTIRP